MGTIFDDDIVPWLSETVGRRPLWYSQRFVETDQGYVYAPNLQPVRNLPNQPLQALPVPEGFWAEVTVPYVDLALDNPPARSPWVKTTAKPRLYYSQVMFIDQIQADSSRQALVPGEREIRHLRRYLLGRRSSLPPDRRARRSLQ